MRSFCADVNSAMVAPANGRAERISERATRLLAEMIADAIWRDRLGLDDEVTNRLMGERMIRLLVKDEDV